MKTILKGTEFTARASRAAKRIRPRQAFACQAGPRAMKAYPVLIPRFGCTRSHAGKRAMWLRREIDVRFEKWLPPVLAGAAVILIAYGFSRLIDLVQNWAAMERGISNLI